MNKTARYFLLDNMFSMTAYWVSTGTVIASLTSYYKLPLTLSNLITGFSATLLIVQLLGGFAYARTQRQNLFVRGACLTWRILLPFVFFSVLLPPNIGMPLMILCYFLAIASFQFSAPGQTDWMVGHVEGQVKSDYYSMREMCFMLLYSGAFCIAGLTLDKHTAAGTLQTAFCVIGGVLSLLLLVSGFYLLRLPPPLVQPVSPQAKRAGFFSPLKNKLFSRVLITNIIWSFSGMFIGGFAAMYQVRILNISFFQIMLWTTAGNLARSVSTPLMAKLAAKIGWKAITSLCLGLLICTALLWMQITPENFPFLFPLVSVLGAVPFAGLGVSFLKMQVETMSPDARSIYFSVNATLNGVASFIGTAVCTTIIGAIEAFSAPGMANSNLKYIFLVGAVGALLSVLACTKIQSQSR